MKIQKSTVTKLTITEVERLDPIDVFLEDFEPGKGTITIRCYGQSWTAYWGAMGGTISQFFCRCDNGYLASNLSGISQMVFSPEKTGEAARKEIIRKRRAKEIEDWEARSLFDHAEYMDDSLAGNAHILSEVWGDEWWHSAKEEQNPDYLYLCRIIDAVRAALKQLAEVPA